MSKELKPCPFCGWGTIVDSGGFFSHVCECNACHAKTDKHKTWEEAVNAWNRRADGWTPVTEQPPEYDGEYFVCFSDGFMTTVTYSTDHDGNQDWELWADSGEVIAWQPLLEPYKEG